MIRGIGIDLVSVADLARRLEHPGFCERVFSPDERTYAQSRGETRIEVLAGRWAAKEAFLKALGTGIRAGRPLREIEVLCGEQGQPEIRLGAGFGTLLPSEVRIHCSISHTAGMATAMVVIEEV